MTQPTTAKHSEFLIKIGDGADPATAVFSKVPLAMMSRGFNSSIATNKITVPDQDNEDLLVDEQSVPSTRSRQMTGKGVLDKATFANSWEGKLGVVWAYQISLTGVGTWTGLCILTATNLSSNRADIVNLDVTIEQANTLTFAGV